MLEQLQLVGSVGAVAGIAGLGVSVAGFAVVLRRLKRLEQNLNGAMGRLRAEVEQLHLMFDMLQMAELTLAWQSLDGASHTDRPERRAELLKDADRCFQKYRNYYYALIMVMGPLNRPELTLPQVRELYGRFFCCALAELEANFLLHDFAQWHYRHEAIGRQLADACAADWVAVLRCRVEALGSVTQAELDALKQQILVTRDVCRENHERILTAKGEVDWLDRHGVAPAEYLRALRDVREGRGIRLFPITVE